jgi:hypothetical protein
MERAERAAFMRQGEEAKELRATSRIELLEQYFRAGLRSKKRMSAQAALRLRGIYRRPAHDTRHTAHGTRHAIHNIDTQHTQQLATQTNPKQF